VRVYNASDSELSSLGVVNSPERLERREKKREEGENMDSPLEAEVSK